MKVQFVHAYSGFAAITGHCHQAPETLTDVLKFQIFGSSTLAITFARLLVSRAPSKAVKCLFRLPWKDVSIRFIHASNQKIFKSKINCFLMQPEIQHIIISSFKNPIKLSTGLYPILIESSLVQVTNSQKLSNSND